MQTIDDQWSNDTQTSKFNESGIFKEVLGFT